MKNHLAFKFAAVILAALLLLSAAASGFGILLLNRYDLYNQSWEEGYEENMRNIREGFAQALVFRFASMELGGCSTPLIDDYYGNGALYTSFRWGRYAYVVRNKNDAELITLDREIPDAEHFEIPVVNGRFVYLISEKDVEETTIDRLQTPPAAEPSEAPTVLTEEPAEVTAATISPVTEETVSATESAPEETASSTESASEETVPSTESASEETVPSTESTSEETVPSTESASEETVPSTESASEETVPSTESASEETVPSTESASEETVASTESASEETASAAPEEASEQYDEPLMEAPPVQYRANPYFTRDQYDEAFSYPYYNYEAGVMKDATLCYANTSDYTVDLYLAPDALYDYQMWDLLKIAAPFRGQLFAVLGGSLLLFSVMMAYLFCAAGKKASTGELEPSGFNLMPLDLYTCIFCLGAVGCLWLTSAGKELFRNTQMIQLAIAAGACFMGSVLFVCYCMAWAAQIKMKDRYFLKNTVAVRGIRLIFKALQWIFKETLHFMKKLPSAWRTSRSCLNKWTHKFLTLMPTMWQWLTCAGISVLLLLLAWIFHSITLLVLGLAAAAALAIYGAYCFSLLLRGVRRMRAGELTTKVDSAVLVGSMKDFAEELNGLAGVAGVAAEKQLKSERMKTELITNVSHDIKTPLTSIINYVDLMGRPHTEEQQQEYMEVLSRQSQRLKKLIDDLMEMSKASTGNMQTEITEVNANEAINQCLGEFADKLQNADLMPVFHPGDAEVTMLADGRLVWRVMSNLLGNAVKYALPGTRVYVDVQELEEEVLISVKNVSREELNISSEELMERFVRGDASRNTEGSGLGLNIAKSLMELQHGQMELLVDGDLFKVTLIFPKK